MTDKMNILIVDDDRGLVKLLSKVLQTMGHECRVAYNGLEALDMILETKFDAILLDIAMPGFSGIEVVEQLEMAKVLDDQNVILLTGFSNTDEINEKLKSRGVVGVLSKPADIDTIVDIVENTKAKKLTLS